MSLVTGHAPPWGSVVVSSWRLALVLSKAIIGGTTLLLVLAAAAHAGRYHAYSCRTPSGESAPVDGWTGSTAGTYTYAENTCSTGGALVAGVGDQIERTANTATATWAFSAPTGATLAAATLWRAGDSDGGRAVNAIYEFWFAGPGDLLSPENAFGICEAATNCPTGMGTTSQPLAAENRLAVPASNLGSHLDMEASCVGVSTSKCPVGAGDAQGYAAVAYLYAADLVLEQKEGPSVSDATGPLATEQAAHGTSDLIFSATDPGSGVYQAAFSVDGKVVQKRGSDNRRTLSFSLPAALSEIGDRGRGIQHDRSQQRHPSPDRERVRRRRQHRNRAGPQHRRPERTRHMQRRV